MILLYTENINVHCMAISMGGILLHRTLQNKRTFYSIDVVTASPFRLSTAFKASTSPFSCATSPSSSETLDLGE